MEFDKNFTNRSKGNGYTKLNIDLIKIYNDYLENLLILHIFNEIQIKKYLFLAL
jgi:hypothetical protein